MEIQRRNSKEQWIDPVTHVSVTHRSFSGSSTLHLHEYYELEIVLEGEGEQNLNGSRYTLTPGTLSLITPIDFHSVSSKTPLLICNISFDETLVPPGLQLTFLNRRNNLIFSAPEDLPLFSSLAEKLAQECGRTDSFSLQARQNILELLLISIARGGSDHSDSMPMLYSKSVQDSMQYLFQHFRSDLKLEEVAAKSGYTASYFSHLFKEISGQRYVDFLTRLRLNYARMLLLTTSSSVADIASTSGFSSQSNFFRAFRKEMGVSPLEYRKARSILG